MKKENKQNIWAIVVFVSVITITITIIQLVGWGLDSLKSNYALSDKAETPIEDTPPIIKEEVFKDIEKIEILPLISSPYTPSKDVFSSIDIYKNESIVIALSGNFEKAELHVKGKVFDKGKHFISINYGNESGTFNATRLSEKSLDINSTEERGGIFTKDEPLDFKINLLGETTLATTKSEFELTKQVVKFVKLWDSNLLPPTVIRVLIAPFNEYGYFGGVTIEEINFEYSCNNNNNNCGIVLCQKDKMFTECLTNNFGWSYAKSWCDRAEDCEM